MYRTLLEIFHIHTESTKTFTYESNESETLHHPSVPYGELWRVFGVCKSPYRNFKISDSGNSDFKDPAGCLKRWCEIVSYIRGTFKIRCRLVITLHTRMQMYRTLL
jgi:hypothetical protein